MQVIAEVSIQLPSLPIRNYDTGKLKSNTLGSANRLYPSGKNEAKSSQGKLANFSGDIMQSYGELNETAIPINRDRRASSGELIGNRRSPLSSAALLTSASRRGSMNPGRRASIKPERRNSLIIGGQVRQVFDEEQMKFYWNNRGLTLQDIEIAFNFLSHDKQKLTHSDIKLFVSTYFDSFPEEAISVLNSWKEEVTMAQLEDVLLNKHLSPYPYESAFKVMDLYELLII